MRLSRFLISLATLAVLALALTAAPKARADSGKPLIVVELYTSQGCSSCPSADAFLGELLERRDDILGLEFHVDYWDNLGWKDLFSSPESTERQRAYARQLGLTYIFTPQMVIQGVGSEVGSDKMAVMTAIEDAHGADGDRLDMSVAEGGDGGLTISLPARADGGAPATIWLVNFDRRHVTDVTAGENTGRKMANNHVVRAQKAIGTWTGAALDLELSADQVSSGVDADGCAILVQSGGHGAIIAAHSLWLDGGS